MCVSDGEAGWRGERPKWCVWERGSGGRGSRRKVQVGRSERVGHHRPGRGECTPGGGGVGGRRRSVWRLAPRPAVAELPDGHSSQSSHVRKRCSFGTGENGYRYSKGRQQRAPVSESVTPLARKGGLDSGCGQLLRRLACGALTFLRDYERHVVGVGPRQPPAAARRRRVSGRWREGGRGRLTGIKFMWW
eukprot:scaffold12364_cov118-Isochrysis_galbana.AAC.2